MDAIDKSNAAKKAYRERLHERGLCIKCRRPLEEDRRSKTLCAECSRKQYERNKGRYDRLKKQGVCVWCGKSPAQHGKTLCIWCGIKRAEIQHNYRVRSGDLTTEGTM